MESNNGNKSQNNDKNNIKIYNINNLIQKLRINDGLSVGNDFKNKLIIDRGGRLTDIRNTNLELLLPLKWDNTNNSKIIIEDDYISNTNINVAADISMSKTNFSPNIEQMTYNGIDGNLEIKDIYIKKLGDTLIGNYAISGFLDIKQREGLSLKGTNDGILMNMYQKSTDLNKSFSMGYLNNNDTTFVFQNLLNNSQFSFNRPVAINKDFVENDIALDVSGDSHIKGSLTIDDDLIVKGTQTILNTVEWHVQDTNIQLGKISTPTDDTADNGGITLLDGTNNKKIIWKKDTNSWYLNQNIDILSGKVYKINNVEVMSATGLGSNIKSSSLTSVGTINSGKWEGDKININNYTNLELDNTSLSWGDTPREENKIYINDIFVKNNGDSIDGDLEINGSFTINSELFNINNDTKNGKYYTNKVEFFDNTIKNASFGYLDQYNHFIFNNNISGGNFIFNSGVGINITPTEMLDINGNIKIRGAMGIIMGDNTNANLLLANNGGFQSTPISGDISIDRMGVATLKSNTVRSNNIINASIKNSHISDSTIDKIDILKTTLSVDTSQLDLTDSKLSIKDIYLKNTGDEITGNLTINKTSNDDAFLRIFSNNSNVKSGIKLGENINSHWTINNKETDGNLVFSHTNNSEIIVINSTTKQIGINKNPTATLDIDGTIKSSESITSKKIVIDNSANFTDIDLNGRFIQEYEQNTVNPWFELKVKNQVPALSIKNNNDVGMMNLEVKERLNVKRIENDALNWNNSSNFKYVKFLENKTMFESGFLMDDINENSVFGSANIIVRKNGVYKSTTITGDVQLDENGEILIQNQKISNQHIINDTTDLIDISKTNLSTENSDNINLIIKDKNILKADIINNSITNNHINDVADISMFKTNFSPNIEQMTYNGIDGNLEVKDIYVKNTGDIINGDLGITNDLSVGNKISIHAINNIGDLHVGSIEKNNTQIHIESKAGEKAGIRIYRGSGDNSDANNNQFGIIVDNDGLNISKYSDKNYDSIPDNIFYRKKRWID